MNEGSAGKLNRAGTARWGIRRFSGKRKVENWNKNICGGPPAADRWRFDQGGIPASGAGGGEGGSDSDIDGSDGSHGPPGAMDFGGNSGRRYTGEQNDFGFSFQVAPFNDINVEFN